MDYGNQLKLLQVIPPQPYVYWPVKCKCRGSDLYTLIMFDPDVTSRENPDVGAVRHWIVGNIEGNNIDTGDVIVEYIGSLPGKGTGLHRYIFLLFKQSKHIRFNETYVPLINTSNRYHFSIRDFIKKYELGEPVSGNFYEAEYDDTEENIIKDFGIIF